MANNILDKRFFTNTYVTGSGRQNYLRIDELEDPLFTSFTLDIDFVSSPLFYTINYSDYGYPDTSVIGNNIEVALEDMYRNYLSIDEGYDILPLLSASILDGNKLGFGLQQNVYIDMPLYGATEYIYMVDKRNGSSSQNDARFDNNKFVDYGANPNALNSYTLGDSVKTIVNDSDRVWAERQLEQNEEQISICDDIMNDEDVINDHKKNEEELNEATFEYNQNNKVTIDGKEYTESDLVQKINEYKNKEYAFEIFKNDIVEWANGEISQYQSRATNVYMSNNCVKKIVSYDDIAICGDSQKEVYFNELEKLYGEKFINEYIYGGYDSYMNKVLNIYEELKSFLNIKNGEDRADIIKQKIIDKFGDKLEYFGLCKKGDTNFTGEVQAITIKSHPEWLIKISEDLLVFVDRPNDVEKIKDLMAFQCDVETSFVNFDSNITSQIEEDLSKYEDALDNLRTGLYGFEDGKPCDMSNASPDSPYGRYLSAKEKYENDDYSQAEKSKSLALSGASEMSNMISTDDYVQEILDDNYNRYVQNDIQPLEVSRYKSIVSSQTVLDMLGFISGMKKMIINYPYIIQGVTGLDTAYNKHYGIKDPYLGSGDDKITLTCLESLDLRVSSMFNRYFNAVYDRQYRRERVPVNLRRFNCSIYVHDVRNFVSKTRLDKNRNHKTTYNRLLELTDMYYSVIEFRFFDCEIVPEETGNIFNDISNEAPTEMKKTNFTFTYGNCVVNFVPQSEVKSHNSIY